MSKNLLKSSCCAALALSAVLTCVQTVKAKPSDKAEVMMKRATLEQNGLLIRPKNFIVNPSTGPVHEVMVTNTTDNPFNGTIEISYNKGWTSTPKSHKISIKPHETKMISQAITKAIDYANNSYPVKVVVKNNSGKEVFKENFVTRCFSAPYYEVKVDGDLKEWKDSIPVSFKSKGKNTTLRTYWDRYNFYIAVEVEEDKFNGTSDSKTPDCVQISISGKKNKSVDNQFVAVASNSMWSGDKVYKVRQLHKLPSIVVENAKIDVERDEDKKITTYEIAIPFSAIKGVRPTAGRGLNFSILVQDPDGTGVREIASIMNMPELKASEKGRSWYSGGVGEFSVNSKDAKFDDRIDFGFCSSLH